MKRTILFYSGLIFCMMLILLCPVACSRAEDNFGDESPPLRGPYLGQTMPGLQPELFAPGIVSTGYSERGPVFSPDGKEMYYCLYGPPFGVFLHRKEVNGRWTEPQVASFSGRYQGELGISPDGKLIVFSSNRPFDNSPDASQYWVWRVTREERGWGIPEPLGRAVNAEGYSGYPCLARSGNLYFFSEREKGRGGADICLSEWKDGQYQESRNLGDAINSPLDEVDPAISPDEDYLIFCRRQKDGDVDLFISFRTEDGSWSEAQNMGEHINSNASEYCPVISADGKVIFFTSTRKLFPSFSETPITYGEKIRILNCPGNGNSDIYWMSSAVIESYRTP